MNNGLKAGIGIAAAALALWGAAMLGTSLLDSGEPKSQSVSTQPTGTKTTLHRPGAGTTTSSSSGQSSGDVVNHIELDRYTVTVAVGETEMPWVTMTPEAAEDKREIWSTSDASVATVDQIGNITGVKAGSCVVTVQAAANPEVKAEVQVTVTAAATTTAATTTAPETESVDELVARVSCKAKEPTYIGGILIVNKTYGLPATFDPGADSEMLAAFSSMRQDAQKQGLTLINSSNYRSYDDQVRLYKKYVLRDGQAQADTYSARPGFSEHQTGLVIDLNSVDDSFAGTPEAEWVAQNAYKYGFIVRYPKGKEDITGYQYEPWHIRYLGVDTATAVYRSGKTLEEYLGITSAYTQ